MSNNNNTGAEADVELDNFNDFNDDGKDKNPLLPVSEGHHNGHEKGEKSETKIIASVIAFYWVCSMSVVFLNKYIFTYADYEFPFPLFVTWYQFLVALVLLIITGFSKSKLFSIVPRYELKLDIAIKILPLTAIYVGMLTFNNLCLAFVEVSFYQVARSLTIIFNIIFTYLILHNKTSLAAIGACTVVFFGFALGSFGELHFSLLGLIFGVCSSVFGALYGIFVKKKLQVVENNEWRLLHYNTTLAIILLFPIVVLSGELKEIKEVYFILRPSFWIIMTVTGVSGFLINIATFLQIKFTTPLTNTISGTAKACTQTVLSVMIFKNPITFINGFGIFLVLLGSLLYSLVRYYKI